jgi:hypothetical protein
MRSADTAWGHDLAVSCRSFGHAKGTGVGPGERARCVLFIHWLYLGARIDWVSMNKHESDIILEQLRQRDFRDSSYAVDVVDDARAPRHLAAAISHDRLEP